MTVLYTVCRLAWQNCLNNIAVFTNRKPFYDAAYVATRITEIDAAEQLPDEQARGETSETLRLHLLDKARVCIEYWRILDRYISSAYPQQEWKPKREAAGSDLFEEANNNNWDKLRTMMSNAFAFINNNSMALSNGNNMPVTFLAEFDGVRVSFNTDHDAFLLAEEAAHTGTQTKQMANEDIYTKLKLMLNDGQIFFINDPAIKEQFVLTSLLDLVGTPGGGNTVLSGTVNTGQIVTIIDTANSEWVAGVTLRVKNTSTGINPVYQLLFYPANSAGEGWYGQGLQLQVGQETTITISAPEFKPFYLVQNQSPADGTFEVEIL